MANDRHGGAAPWVQPAAGVAAIIRLCYYLPDVDEASRAWRFELFRTEVLPRLRPQADVWVWVNPKHADEVQAMGHDVHIFTVDLGDPRSVAFNGTTLRGFPWSAVRGLPRYEVQLLLGSDDLVSPNFVAVAAEALARVRRQRALVSFQPLMLDWRTQRLYRMKEWDRPSPIVALRQDVNDPNYTWVWARDHRHLGRDVRRVVHVPAGHAVMLVHGHNDGTRLRGAVGEIERGTVPWL